MAIHYECRHCRTKLGSINHSDEERLGFHLLNEEERETMINYDDRGETHVKAICEECEKALTENPDYHQFESFLQ
ncbi:anti-sigma-F factor Fin family protein [Alteribacter aurantiacus]|uniref:anti-sigma-F factor Fin family protein n=1 Tax=Alteribacter aurantiacus TaxID=254410 RepID=UPI0004277087|nr:anti-sigma-F factor Fin family protein [Alteribacter aurantiacus]